MLSQQESGADSEDDSDQSLLRLDMSVAESILCCAWGRQAGRMGIVLGHMTKFRGQQEGELGLGSNGPRFPETLLLSP